MQMDVSIIIVNWNTRDILDNSLKSVYGQTSGIAFEIIVIDNASTDGSVKMIKTEFPQVILVGNAENRGFAAANNQGMEISQGRYILLLNSDTIILDNAIKKTVDVADSKEQAGIIACRVLNPDRSLQLTCSMFPSILNMFLWITYLHKLFPHNRFFCREHMTWWNYDDTREVDVVFGCFMLVRHEALEQVGTMDEQYFMYFEETDLCWRFKKSGWKVMFTPCAEIVHLGGSSSGQVKSEMMLYWKKSMLLFYKKHKDPFSAILAWFLINLFFVSRIPYWRLKGHLAKTLNYTR